MHGETSKGGRKSSAAVFGERTTVLSYAMWHAGPSGSYVHELADDSHFFLLKWKNKYFDRRRVNTNQHTYQVKMDGHKKPDFRHVRLRGTKHGKTLSSFEISKIQLLCTDYNFNVNAYHGGVSAKHNVPKTGARVSRLSAIRGRTRKRYLAKCIISVVPPPSMERFLRKLYRSP